MISYIYIYGSTLPLLREKGVRLPFARSFGFSSGMGEPPAGVFTNQAVSVLRRAFNELLDWREQPRLLIWRPVAAGAAGSESSPQIKAPEESTSAHSGRKEEKEKVKKSEKEKSRHSRRRSSPKAASISPSKSKKSRTASSTCPNIQVLELDIAVNLGKPKKRRGHLTLRGVPAQHQPCQRRGAAVEKQVGARSKAPELKRRNLDEEPQKEKRQAPALQGSGP